MFETHRIDAFSVIITCLPMSMLQDPIPLIIIVMCQCTRIALKELRMSNENFDLDRRTRESRTLPKKII